MVERVVRVAVCSYEHPDGTVRFGIRGETVDVSDGSVARFDELDADPEAPPPQDTGFVRKPHEPPRAGPGSGRDAWAAYAAVRGVTINPNAGRDAIIAAIDEQE